MFAVLCVCREVGGDGIGDLEAVSQLEGASKSEVAGFARVPRLVAFRSLRNVERYHVIDTELFAHCKSSLIEIYHGSTHVSSEYCDVYSWQSILF